MRRQTKKSGRQIFEIRPTAIGKLSCGIKDHGEGRIEGHTVTAPPEMIQFVEWAWKNRKSLHKRRQTLLIGFLCGILFGTSIMALVLVIARS